MDMRVKVAKRATLQQVSGQVYNGIRTATLMAHMKSTSVRYIYTPLALWKRYEISSTS